MPPVDVLLSTLMSNGMEVANNIFLATRVTDPAAPLVLRPLAPKAIEPLLVVTVKLVIVVGTELSATEAF